MHRLIDEIGLRYYGVHDVLTPSAIGMLTPNSDGPIRFDRSELRERVDASGAQFVACRTADRLQAEILRPTRAFHVIRDPRDLIVSAYFSHRDSHPTDVWPQLHAHRKLLQTVPPQEGLLLEMEFSKIELLQIGDWNYADGAVLEVKMEELVRDSYDGFIRIVRHLGLLREDEPTRATEQVGVLMGRLRNRLSTRRCLRALKRKMPASGEMVLGNVYAQRFEVQTRGRERGVEDTTQHYRKGIAGDWVNHFAREHADAFNAHFGDLLVRLGYEESSDWFERMRESS